MKVLVSAASKHGATDGIARAIAAQLRADDIEVDEMPIALIGSKIGMYDAFVVGSAVYMGRWLGQARDFVDANADVLGTRPVWLFSSGPITDKADPANSADGESLLKLIHGREHRLFAGKLDKDDLGWTERAVVRMVHSPWGDYRPWEEIKTWSDSIARELSAVPA